MWVEPRREEAQYAGALVVFERGEHDRREQSEPGAYTEADIRLFPTLLRFDAVYHDLFRCNRKHLADYPNLWAYTRDIYQWPGVAATVDMGHIRLHYYESLTALNPTGAVPDFGLPDLDRPADRGKDIARLLTF